MIPELFPHQIILISLALAAGFYMAWNIGVNDVANAVGTSVGSGTLTLRQAVLMAAVMEFSGAFFFGSHVSQTIQTGIVSPYSYAHEPQILVYGMMSALLAAGAWLQVASYFGLPVSTTHCMVGAIVGFGWVTGGYDAINWSTVVSIGSSWVISPLLGGLMSYALFNVLRHKIFYARHPVEAAKRLAPRIIFGTVTVLSIFLMSEGLSHVEMPGGFFTTLLISLFIALLVTLISYLWIARIVLPTPSVKTRPTYASEVAVELDKAQKHLQRVKVSATAEMFYSVSAIIDELKSLSETLKEPEEKSDNSEYKMVERIFGFLQVLSASLMAFAHGANDVANAIGPLAACIGILTTGSVILDPVIPTWLLALGGVGIVIGLATWGWRVVETIGRKLTELTPSRGFAAELGAAATIVLASGVGMPISTTHTLVGAVLGVACARGIGALNLTTTRDIVISWIVTVPAGAGLAILFFFALRATFG